MGQFTNAIAISTPGHFACGNLNFFSSHPCIGRYYALVPSEIISVPQSLMKSLMRADPELAQLISIQLELCTLSDRMAFGADTALPADMRLKVFFIAWFRNYGRFVAPEGGEGWCVMPISVQRKYLAAIIAASRVWLDKTFKDWKNRDLYRTDGSFVLMRPSLLEPGYRWLVEMEEASRRARPELFSDWLALIEERRVKLGSAPYPVSAAALSG